MALTMLCSFLIAFLGCAVFGKYYIPWLEKKNARQPLKDEVAKIYAEKDDDSEKNSDQGSKAEDSRLSINNLQLDYSSFTLVKVLGPNTGLRAFTSALSVEGTSLVLAPHSKKAFHSHRGALWKQYQAPSCAIVLRIVTNEICYVLIECLEKSRKRKQQHYLILLKRK